MSNKSRYNLYTGLFGPADDRRPRILLNIAEDQFKRDGTVILDQLPKEIDSANYTRTYGFANGTVSAEFFKFLNDATKYINANKQDVLKIITTLGQASEPLQNTVNQLVITLFQPVNSTNTLITNNADLRNTVDINPILSLMISKLVNLIPAAMATVFASIPDAKDFSFRYDAHFIASLLEEACKNDNVGSASSKFFDNDDDDRISRDYTNDKSCAPTMLAIDNKNGHIGAIDHLRQNYNNNCATTGVKDSGMHTCQGYLQDCLQGKNIKECASYMQNPNFWADAQKEVKHMNPLMIVKTLEAFNFTLGVDNNGLKVVPSPAEWLKNVQGLTPAEIAAIGANNNLMGYLSMLVDRTNNNPTILNPAVNVNGVPSRHPSRLNSMGIPPLRVRDDHIKNMNHWINATRAQTYRVGGFLGIPNVFSGLTAQLTGGAYTNNLDEFTKRTSENYVGTADMFTKHVEALGYRLQNMGKQIHQGDLAKINALIDSLRNSENKLNKTMLYAEKYARLLETHGLKDSSAHVISMDHLKEFVDQRNKYFDRVSRRQTDLYSVLTSIAEAVSNKN